MIEVRETTDKEKAKHSNMAYVIDLGHSKQWFTEKALVELLDKMHEIVNENGLLQRVGNRDCVNCDTVGSIEWVKVCGICGKEF